MDAIAIINGLAALVVLVGVYLFPTIIAGIRGKRNTFAIGMLNLITGWTFIGWVAAFIWACCADVRAQEPELLLVPAHWAANDN